MSKFTGILFLLCFFETVLADNHYDQQRSFVALRMIGHELLLRSGDSTSRVMPVEITGNRYKVYFEHRFSFDPENLAGITDSVVALNRIASAYIVEVVDCDSGKVVYSYRVDRSSDDLLPSCRGRLLPDGCYLLYFQIITPVTAAVAAPPTKSHYSAMTFSIFLLLALGLILYFIFRKKTSTPAGDLIHLGSFYFDPKNMALIRGKEKQELTGKENDLLELLYRHLNTTVDRDIILKEVWRDEEAAYIGRTLDVYISKLRKKFEVDPSISIVNVRGVGYKMTLN